MKTLLRILLFLYFGSAIAQVKIGNEINTIDASSILELESVDKVFVLTRVTTAQMNTIVPLSGAMVYNTDVGCVHQFNGVNWVALCDTFVFNETHTVIFDNNDGTFSYTNENNDTVTITKTQLIDNGDGSFRFDNGNGSPIDFIGTDNQNITSTDGSLAVTPTGKDFDISVNTTNITGDGNITSTDLIVGGDTNALLGNVTLGLTDKAITLPKLADGSAAGQLMQWNGTAWVLVDDSALTVTEVDGVIGNEVLNATDGTLVRSGAGTNTDPYTLDVAAGQINTAELADNAVTTAKIDDGSITTDKILDRDISLQKLTDGITTGQIIRWDGTNWILSNETTTTLESPVGAENTLRYTDENTNVTTIPNIVRSVNGVNPAPNGNVAVILSSVSTGLEADRPVTAVDSDIYIISGEVAPNSDRNGVAFIYDDPTGWQEVTTDLSTTDARYVNIIGDAMTGPLAMGDNTITGITDPVNAQDAATKSYVDALASGDITSTDIDITGGTNAAFNNVNLSIADNAVTTAKVADGNITLPKLADGTAAGQLMQWNGTAWVLVDDSALTITEVDGVIGNEVLNATDGTLVRSGAGTNADPYTLDVAAGQINTAELTDNAVTTAKVADDAITTAKILDGNITTAKVADDAVTTAKVLDGNITTAKVADGNITLPKLADGSAAGQLMQWNGTAWVLVDDSALTITEVDGVIGNEVLNATDGTLVRSGAGTNADPYTLDVGTGQINTAELADNAVTTAKVADDAITTAKILDGNITTAKIADDAVTTAKVLDGNITLPKLADGSAAGQLMQWNGTAWVLVDDSALTITEVDGVIGNEVLNATDGTLVRSGAGTNADPYTLDVAAGQINTAELADNAVTTAKIAADAIDNTKLADNAVNTENITDGTIATADIADDAVTTAKIVDGNITTAKIADDAVTTAKVLDGNITTAKVADGNITLPKLADGSAAGQLMQWNGTAWVLVDDSALTITEVDGVIGNEVLNATDGTLVRSGAGTDADPYTLDVAAGQINTAELADNAVTTVKVLDGNITTAKIAADAIDNTKLADNAVNTENITDGTIATADIADDAVTTAKIVDDAITTAKVADDAITTAKVLDGNITLPKLADGSAAGQLMQWNGTAWVLVDDSALTITEVDGVIGNEVLNATDGTLVRSGAGTNADPYTLDVAAGQINTAELADNAVTTAKVADDAITTAKILDGNITTAKVADDAITTAKVADDAITTAKVLDGNITLPKLADGSAAGQLMQWNGTAWVLVDDSALTVTEVDGVIGNEVLNATDGTLVRSGAGTDADPYTLDVATGQINTAELADNAVTTAKVAADAIDNTKLADNAVNTENITDGTIATADIADDAITTAKVLDGNITTAKLADGSLTTAKLADGSAAGQLMQWNGTAWVLVDDSALTVTEVDGVIGNEVTNATDGTLVRSGAGTDVDPYTLDVAAGQINTAELADNAVTTAKVAADAIDNTKLADNAVNTENITDGTIATADIADDAVTTAKILDGNITTAKIADDAVTTAKVLDGNITTAKVADGNITLPKLADGSAAGQLMQWNGTAWVLVDDSALTITEVDGVIGNEVLNATDGTLVRSGAGTNADPYTLDVAAGQINTAELADNAVTTAKVAADAIDNTKLADNAVNTENITDGTIATADIADDAITTAKVLDGNITTAKVADGNITLPKLADGSAAGQLMQWNGTAWVLVDDSALTITEVDGVIGNEVTNATDGTLVRSGAGTDADPYTLDVAAGQINTAELADNAVTTAKVAADAIDNTKLADNAVNTENITDGTIATADIADDAITTAKVLDGNITTAKLADGSAAGQLMQWNGTAWVLVDDSALTITEVDGVIGNEVLNATDGTLVRSGAGTDADPYTLDVGTGQINTAELADNAVTTAKVAADAIDNTKLADNAVNTENITDGTIATADIADDAVTTAKIVDDAITTAKIADDAVTTAKVLDGNITTAKLADGSLTTAKLADGSAAGQLMQWNGTAWVLVDDSALTITEVDGVIGNEVLNATDGTLVRSGAGTDADPYTLDVGTGQINTVELADNAVTTAKVAADAIDNTKLADNAVNTENIADGTIATADIADDAITTAKVLDGNITTAKIADDAVTTAKVLDGNITTAKLADGSLTTAKLADGSAAGQLMQWNGTAWVLVDDSALTVTEVDGVIGNEVTNATDGTLVRSGAGTNADPYTLDVGTGQINTAELADNAVTTAKVAADAIDNTKLADNAVNTENITDGTIATADIADDAITSAKILDGNITTAKISDDAVTTAKVLDGNITTAKLADGSLTTAKLADGSAAGQLMQWNGTAWVLVDDSALTVTEVDGVIGNEVTNATDGTLVRSGAGTDADPYTLDVGTGQINTAELADNAVTTAKVAADAIDNTKLADNAVNTENITDGTIATADIADDAVTTAKIADDAITTAKVLDGNITTAKIANDAVTTVKIAPGGNDQLLMTDGTGTVTWSDASILSQTTTNLTQNTSTGIISYVNEIAATQTANVISANTGNSISAGTDGGAFFNSMVKAIGKVSSAGVLTKGTTGITITKTPLTTGTYRVNIPVGMVADANYIIHLTQPGRGGVGNDDPGISYSNQTITGFDVIMGDNDNGGTDRALFDSEFMFIILDL